MSGFTDDDHGESRGVPGPTPARGRPGSQVDSPFVPLAIWSAGSFLLLGLATTGPKLWATQSGENATIAIEIVAIGQALLAVILWPIWTRGAACVLGVALSSPAWILLAGRIAAATLPVAGAIAWKVGALLLALAAVRTLVPRNATGFAWALLVGFAIGAPVLWMLQRGG